MDVFVYELICGSFEVLLLLFRWSFQQITKKNVYFLYLKTPRLNSWGRCSEACGLQVHYVFSVSECPPGKHNGDS